MKYNISHRLCKDSSIIRIAEDIKLTQSFHKDKIWTNLGVGSPYITTEIHNFWNEVVQSLDHELLTRNLEKYGEFGGTLSLKKIICTVFNAELGWEIEPENVLITNGSQNLFYMLSCIFTAKNGPYDNKKILIPMVPEYPGYGALTIDPNSIDAILGLENILDEYTFQYQIDIDMINSITTDYSSVLLSQPKNPSGGVLSEQELVFLQKFSQKRNIPLIIDSAYGNPFPSLCYEPISLPLTENMLYSFSLSKCGIPASRVGIAIGEKYLIKALLNFQCNSSIQPAIYGQMLAEKALNGMRLLSFCQEHLKPLYWAKYMIAMSCLKLFFEDVQWQVHKYEGGMFLWLRFLHKDLFDSDIYDEAKKEQLIVIPGSIFFFGVSDEIKKTQACIRISLAVEDDELQRGFQILSRVVNKLIENANTKC